MEGYKIAADLYASSLRALEQRSIAFLFIQSIFATGYAVLFGAYNNGDNIPFTAFYGIALLGVAFCLLTYFSGRTTSQDAWIWRKIMQDLENNNDNNLKLWTTFLSEGKIFSLQKHCIERLPAPTLWIISPALFFAAWISSILLLYNMNVWIYIILVLVIGIITLIIYFSFTKYNKKT